MPVSPTAAKKLGDKFGTAPICVGPWQFVERVAQDRIVLEKSTHYFDPGAAKFDRDRLPHHPRRQRAAGQPALGRHRPDAPGGADRRRQPQEGGPLRGLERHRPRLSTRSPSTSTTRPARTTRRATWARRWPTTRACARRSSCRIDREALNQVAWDGLSTRRAARRSPPSAPSTTRAASARAATWPGPRSSWPTPGWPSGYSFEMVDRQ